MADTLEKTRRKTRTEKRTKRPPMYKVYLLNDDYTTMDFVVFILQEVFGKPYEEAVQIMLHVHRAGMGLCGVYTKEIAETKVETVHRLARANQFPLKCMIERE
ncbi:MAG: ATP-dependent Clp protease adapter ClpS [Nitrospirae bacterium]|nr:MAG: ATP-dependent Clp protease adapter ClpS [Nitrospirota bacterium]